MQIFRFLVDFMAPAIGQILFFVFARAASHGATASGQSFAVVTGPGNPACRCITIDEAADYHARVNVSLNPSLDHVSHDKLRVYGIGCGKHDRYSPFVSLVCAAVEPPAFCFSAWCYIVKEECSLNSRPSAIFAGLSYSYSTCGYMDRYQTSLTALSLNGVTLNIVQMTNTGGWKGAYCNNGTEVCTGATVDLLYWALGASGAVGNVTATFWGGRLQQYPHALAPEVLNQVYLDNPNQQSTFEACVYATGMGYVDICIGAFSVLPNRRLKTPMIHLYSEPLILVTKTETEEALTWHAALAKAFKPFQPEVWVVIFVAIVLMSWIIALLEYSEGGMFEEHTFIQTMTYATFLGLRSFVDGTNVFFPRRPGGRYAGLGLGFFLLLVISSYTANLATFLIRTSRPSAVLNSWDEVLSDEQITVCGDSALKEFLTTALRLPVERFTPMLSRFDVLPAVGTEKCVVAVITQEDFESSRSGGKFCDLIKVGEPLHVSDQGAPVSERVLTALSYYDLQAKKAGIWHAALGSRKPKDICALEAKKAQDNSQYSGMKLEDLTGPFAVSGCLCLLGIIARLAHCIMGEACRDIFHKQLPDQLRTAFSLHGQQLTHESIRKIIKEEMLEVHDSIKDEIARSSQVMSTREDDMSGIKVQDSANDTMTVVTEPVEHNI